MVERAYDLAGSHDTWLDGLHAELRPFFGFEFGLRATSWAMRNNEFTDLSVERGDLNRELGCILSEMVRETPPEWRARVYGPNSGDFVGNSEEVMPGITPAFVNACRARGIVGVTNLFGMLVLGHPGRNGLAFVAPTSAPITLSGAQHRRLRQVMTHLSSGFRLRLAVEGLVQPEAVLSVAGEVLHAEAPAQADDARLALSAAVRQIEKCRGRLRRTDPEEALSLWKGLVSGRWTIVDWVDSDRRRYLVAYENRVSARHPRSLSPRELDVAEYLVQGRSMSEIAWALGLSIGTVSRMSRDVLRKLNISRRSDLSAIFGAVAPFELSVDDESLRLVAAGANDRLWERLTAAERAVVELMLAGHSVAAIARRRVVSAKTVSNQLGSIYARFGVRGRVELAALLGSSSRGALETPMSRP